MISTTFSFLFFSAFSAFSAFWLLFPASFASFFFFFLLFLLFLFFFAFSASFASSGYDAKETWVLQEAGSEYGYAKKKERERESQPKKGASDKTEIYRKTGSLQTHTLS